MRNAFERLGTVEKMLVEARSERRDMLIELAEMRSANRTAWRWFGTGLAVLSAIAAVSAVIGY